MPRTGRRRDDGHRAPLPMRRPILHKVCEQCGRDFDTKRPSARFCCAGCNNASQRTRERKDLKCEACGATFNTTRDHGVWPRFCSRKCFLAGAVRAAEKECAHCGSMFTATKASHQSEDGLRKYCSKQCREAGLRIGQEKVCVNCGATFYLSPSKVVLRPDDGCCSAACQASYYTGSRAHAYRTGTHIHSDTGDTYVLMKRPGYVGAYIGEHRLIASRAIGRLITRNEVVIRVNNKTNDNRPENLFICASRSEHGRRRQGSLPWPKNGNLDSYQTTAPTSPPASAAGPGASGSGPLVS